MGYALSFAQPVKASRYVAELLSSLDSVIVRFKFSSWHDFSFATASS
jgi:hypothetical protein